MCNNEGSPGPPPGRPGATPRSPGSANLTSTTACRAGMLVLFWQGVHALQVSQAGAMPLPQPIRAARPLPLSAHGPTSFQRTALLALPSHPPTARHPRAPGPGGAVSAVCRRCARGAAAARHVPLFPARICGVAPRLAAPLFLPGAPAVWGADQQRPAQGEWGVWRGVGAWVAWGQHQCCAVKMPECMGPTAPPCRCLQKSCNGPAAPSAPLQQRCTVYQRAATSFFPPLLLWCTDLIVYLIHMEASTSTESVTGIVPRAQCSNGRGHGGVPERGAGTRGT